MYNLNCKSLWIKASAKCINVNVKGNIYIYIYISPPKKEAKVLWSSSGLSPCVEDSDSFLLTRGVNRTVYHNTIWQFNIAFANTLFTKACHNLFWLYPGACKQYYCAYFTFLWIENCECCIKVSKGYFHRDGIERYFLVPNFQWTVLKKRFNNLKLFFTINVFAIKRFHWVLKMLMKNLYF